MVIGGVVIGGVVGGVWSVGVWSVVCYVTTHLALYVTGANLYISNLHTLKVLRVYTMGPLPSNSTPVDLLTATMTDKGRLVLSNHAQ